MTSFSFCFFLGLDVGVSQEVELEEEGEDGGGRESEAAGTSEDVMRRKQELKLDLGPDYVLSYFLLIPSDFLSRVKLTQK